EDVKDHGRENEPAGDVQRPGARPAAGNVGMRRDDDCGKPAGGVSQRTQGGNDCDSLHDDALQRTQTTEFVSLPRDIISRPDGGCQFSLVSHAGAGYASGALCPKATLTASSINTAKPCQPARAE